MNGKLKIRIGDTVRFKDDMPGLNLVVTDIKPCGTCCSLEINLQNPDEQHSVYGYCLNEFELVERSSSSLKEGDAVSVMKGHGAGAGTWKIAQVAGDKAIITAGTRMIIVALDNLEAAQL
jgi:hypothetical protein